MDLSFSSVYQEAKERLASQKDSARSVIRGYVLVWLGVQIVATLLSMGCTWLGDSMSGLGQAGTRNLLDTLALVLPLVAALAMMLWKAGYSGAILDLSRGQGATWRTMTWSFGQLGRFLICGLRLLGLTFVGVYALTFVAATVVPQWLIQGDTINTTSLSLLTALATVIPLLLIYRRRLLFFLMADRGEIPAGALNRSAVALLRGYGLKLLKVDLHFWWYYVLALVLYALPYLTLLVPETYQSWFTLMDLGVFFLQVLGTTLLDYCFRNRIWATYALVYEKLSAVSCQ